MDADAGCRFTLTGAWTRDAQEPSAGPELNLKNCSEHVEAGAGPYESLNTVDTGCHAIDQIGKPHHWMGFKLRHANGPHKTAERTVPSTQSKVCLSCWIKLSGWQCRSIEGIGRSTTSVFRDERSSKEKHAANQQHGNRMIRQNGCDPGRP